MSGSQAWACMTGADRGSANTNDGAKKRTNTRAGLVKPDERGRNGCNMMVSKGCIETNVLSVKFVSAGSLIVLAV